MPKFNHDDLESVLDCIYRKGVIVSVDAENDLAGVKILGHTWSNVPLYYHCEPDSELRDNGAIYGAASAFSAGTEEDTEDGDEVFVQCRCGDGETLNEPIRVVGFVDGLRLCGCKYAAFYKYEDDDYHYIIWNMKTKALATDVVSNNGEIVTEFPAPYAEGDDNGISGWVDSRESCEDIEDLWEVVPNDPPGLWITDYDDTGSEDVGCPGGGAYHWTLGHRIQELHSDGQYGADTYSINRSTQSVLCVGAETYTLEESIADEVQVTYTGNIYIATNGSEKTLSFSQEETYHYAHNQKNENGVVVTSEVSKQTTIAYFFDLFDPLGAYGESSGVWGSVKPDPVPAAWYKVKGWYHLKQNWLLNIFQFRQGGVYEVQAVSEYGLDEIEIEQDPTLFEQNTTLSGLLSSGAYSDPSFYK